MANGKVIKSKVVAFRLTPEEYALFEKAYDQDKTDIQGVRSAFDMCRKLAMDYAMGRLRWKTEKARKTTYEVEVAKAAVATPAG